MAVRAVRTQEDVSPKGGGVIHHASEFGHERDRSALHSAPINSEIGDRHRRRDGRLEQFSVEGSRVKSLIQALVVGNGCREDTRRTSCSRLAACVFERRCPWIVTGRMLCPCARRAADRGIAGAEHVVSAAPQRDPQQV